jgi:hypothetical protein
LIHCPPAVTEPGFMRLSPDNSETASISVKSVGKNCGVGPKGYYG